MPTTCRVFFHAIVLCLGWSALAHAADPSPADWLPATTRGYLHVPDGPALREAFATTRLSQFVHDPLMTPFVEDVRHKIEQRLGELQSRMGITWKDLQAAQAGSWATAAVELEDKAQPYAFVIMVDTQGKDAERAALLDKVATTMTRESAQAAKRLEHQTEITVYTLPREPGARRERRLAMFVRDNWLIATDQPTLAASIASAMAAPSQDALSSVPAYQAILAQVHASAVGEQIHFQWFVEPFGYARILRSIETSESNSTRRGRSWHTVLADQGFDAIQAVGGGFRLGTGQDELIHCTHIYAPGAAQAATEFRLAARMLNFPSGGDFDPPDWVPQHVGSYASFNVEFQKAFDYVGTLIDAVMEQEGFFESVLEGIRTEEFGPQIDLRKELVAYAGNRIRIISDYELPISPQCERLLVAIEVTDTTRVAEALERTLKDDPNVQRLEHEGHVIWELLNGEDEDIEAPEVVTPGFNALGGDEESEAGHERIFPNSAITVVHGQLIWTSHVDFAVRLLTPPEEDAGLSQLPDYRRIAARLEELGSNGDSFRFFSQSAEDYRPTYELIRAGKMPESQTLLGKILNRLLGPEERNVLRQQRLDGSKLPEYDAVRHYFGASGTYVHTLEQGWLIVGTMVPPTDNQAASDGPEYTASNPNE